MNGGPGRLTRAASVAAIVLMTACAPAEEPPDFSDGAPVLNRQGQVVGTADPEAIDEAAQGGEPAEVHSDGELVGHFGPDGFEPLGESAD